MIITLKNIKHAQFASEETECFEATVYLDGVKAGTVRNDGHGGCNNYFPYDLEDRLNAYAKTLPPEKAGFEKGDGSIEQFDFHPDADSLINDVLTRELQLKDLRKALKSKILFTKAGTPGIFETRKLDAAHKGALLAKPHLIKDHEKILNLLPEAEAFALYIGAAA